MLTGDFKAKQEYLAARQAVAALLAADEGREVTVRDFNKAHAILAPFISRDLTTRLALR